MQGQATTPSADPFFAPAGFWRSKSDNYTDVWDAGARTPFQAGSIGTAYQNGYTDPRDKAPAQREALLDTNATAMRTVGLRTGSCLPSLIKPYMQFFRTRLSGVRFFYTYD